jgi:hypothetical protein
MKNTGIHPFATVILVYLAVAVVASTVVPLTGALCLACGAAMLTTIYLAAKGN